jgi:transcriptional regulator with XRE-family HTH domain
MSSTRASRHAPDGKPVDAVSGHTDRLATRMGLAIHEERRRRRMTIRSLATRAGISSSTVHKIENGARASIAMYVRVARALDRTLECQLVDPHGRPDSARDDADIVHAAMGELEVATLRSHGIQTGLDEPWQHYHFAGRADVLGWDTALSVLLRIENRTRFPDVQDSIGRFKNEQRYLATALWRPLGFDRPPRTQLHVMVGLWSAEVLRVLRQRPETFRSTFPDPPDGFFAWMAGALPTSGGTTFVLLDPLATGRQRRFIGLEEGLAGARPRLRGYADAADRLRAVR